MTEQSQLKLLVRYDSAQNEYSVLGHNLTAEQVDQQKASLDQCASPGELIALDQRNHHKTTDPQECRTCKEQVRRQAGLQPSPKFKRREA